jgi:hypothetical protein
MVAQDGTVNPAIGGWNEALEELHRCIAGRFARSEAGRPAGRADPVPRLPARVLAARCPPRPWNRIRDTPSVKISWAPASSKGLEAMPSTDGPINAPTATSTIISGMRRSVASSCASRPAPSMSPKSRRMCSTPVVPSLSAVVREAMQNGMVPFLREHDPGGGILARGGVHPRWANLQRVARVLGRSTDVHEYADPRRVAQELAEGVRQAYEHEALSDTLVRRLHDLIDSAY